MPDMNTRRRTLPILLAAIAAASLLLAGYFALRASRPSASVPEQDAPGMALAGASIGGPFRLVDQAGRTVTDRDLRARYALMYFGYSFCPDVCPTDLQRMSQALTAFERDDPARGSKVQPVFVTVDPARDTVAALAAYARNFHPRLLALTGDAGAVAQATKSYRVYASRRPDAGAAEYLMDHSSFTYLMAPGGKPIAALDSRGTADELKRMLAAYVR